MTKITWKEVPKGLILDGVLYRLIEDVGCTLDEVACKYCDLYDDCYKQDIKTYDPPCISFGKDVAFKRVGRIDLITINKQKK